MPVSRSTAAIEIAKGSEEAGVIMGVKKKSSGSHGHRICLRQYDKNKPS
jgi:hypothetical protein